MWKLALLEYGLILALSILGLGFVAGFWWLAWTLFGPWCVLVAGGLAAVVWVAGSALQGRESDLGF